MRATPPRRTQRYPSLERIQRWSETQTRENFHIAMLAYEHLDDLRRGWIDSEVASRTVATRLENPQEMVNPITCRKERVVVLEELARGEDPASNARRALGR